MRVARVLLIAVAAMVAAACSTYPRETQYSIYADTPPRPMTPPVATQPVEPPPPAPVQDDATMGTAIPYEDIQGGALPPAVTGAPLPPPAAAPPPVPTSPPAPVVAGARYTIQAGDTLSGVGRRFQTSVQTLIDMNGLGASGAIQPGQGLVLPDSAIDNGADPYATGPSPVGVRTPNGGVTPPPPPPPPPALVTPPPPPAATSPVPPPASNVSFGWPVRGDILRRFGPVGMGERNLGINIGAPAGQAVSTSAGGVVRYVGDDQPGQGLTVIVVHPGGWRTVYGHLGSALVEYGDEVRAGQQIGTVGLTAGDGRPSIHFEIRKMNGDDPVAMDPLTLLPR